MADAARDPLAWVDEALSELDRAGLRRRLAERRGGQHAAVTLDGRRLVNFGSNDYLGLAADGRLADAARAAAARHGWGSGASPLVSGRSSIHAELECRLAEFEGSDAALVFPSGFAAGAGTIPALVDAPDAIFADERNHASLIDGCRLARAKRFIYPHADCDALEGLLRQSQHFRRRLIVSDTLFSMDGDLAPVGRLTELADRYDAMLLVDEAHATGVFGRTGRGVLEHPGSPIRIATLSKALGSAGGFVCGSRRLIEYLAQRARTYVFSTAGPPASAAAALAALAIVRDEPARRRELLARAAAVRGRLGDQGWDTAGSQSHIIPLVVGDAEATMRLAGRLREAGYYVPPIRPPSVPAGRSLLRLSLCHHHTEELVDGLLSTLARLR